MSAELERTSGCVVRGGPAGAVLSLLLARIVVFGLRKVHVE
ncbi:MAG: hypothetical protein ACREXY_02040 [Gammaproteobacteria bacterium]